MPFDQLGPYKIGERLGRGGMGTVYAAQHVETGERVAIKVLADSLAHENGFRERFAVEIEALRQLRHPNIVELYGFGEQAGTLFYSMELVEGPSLEELLRGGRIFAWAEATDLAVQICRALKHAHDRGVIHRDLKPANLLIPPNGPLKLADFGISKFFGATNLTAVGGLVGTADFMAPEQADGRPVTHRCDLYSLGGVMYAMLAGRPAFQAATVVEMLQLQRFAEPEPLRKYAPGIPAELEEIVAKLMQKDPDARIPTATSLLRRLEAMRLGIPVREPADEPARSDPAASPPPAAAAPPSAVPSVPAAAPPAPSPAQPVSASASDTQAPPGAGSPRHADAPAASPTGAGKPNLGETTAHDEYIIAGVVGDGPAVDAFRAARADFNLANDLAQGDRTRPATRDTQKGAAPNPPVNIAGSINVEPAPSLPAGAQPSAIKNDAPAVVRYTDVADEPPPWQDLVSDVTSPWKSLQTWVLIGTLIAMAYFGWRFLKPPSADELFARISTAAASGDEDDLLAASPDIDRFIERFPNDDRIGEVSEHQRRIVDLRTERRVDSRSRIGKKENPSPLEQTYAEALQLAEFDPDAARRKLQAIVDLYEGTDESPEAAATAANARRALSRLNAEAEKLHAGQVKLVERVLERADSLAADDVAEARKLWDGVVELYDGKSWAVELVARARRELAAHPAREPK